MTDDLSVRLFLDRRSRHHRSSSMRRPSVDRQFRIAHLERQGGIEGLHYISPRGVSATSGAA